MNTDQAAPLLNIRDLEITFPNRVKPFQAVKKASLTLNAGEIHAVVGESGSGKTMLARSILQLLPPPARITAGAIHFQGRDLAQCSPEDMRAIRGAEIGMIFQEPLVSLNPALKIGYQLCEGLKLHTKLSDSEVRKRAIELLEAVRITDPERCMEQYPHEFSGGMRQRIMIASAMMLRPRLLLADEPTTALDAIVQKNVLDIMQEIGSELGVSILLISHDLPLVARYADHVTVMEKGLVVEQGSVEEVIQNPQHPYTQKLLASLPNPKRDRPDDSAATPEPVLRAKDLDVEYSSPSPWPFMKPTSHHVVKGVSFDIGRGEMLGLVGESGSGKSTVGRALLRLKDLAAGSITFDGQDVSLLQGRNLLAFRQQVQVVFQDPFSSLNPRMKIGQIVQEGLRHTPGIGRGEMNARTAEMLDAVGLGKDFENRFVHELSGGQRQRVAIARALITRPSLVIADEPVSALDVTIQAQILDLLRRLKAEMGFSCLFISHDLAVVEAICDRTLIMYCGEIVEQGKTGLLFEHPQHDYTKQLVEAAPKLEFSAA